MGAGYTGLAYSSIINGDYDNDGDLDIAVTGYDSTSGRFMIYTNNGGSFTLDSEPMGTDLGVYWSSIINGDYDNDGDLDIALTGTDDGGTTKRFIIYKNNGGSFTEDSEPMGTNVGVYWGSIINGDYDNDGDLDIALTGTIDGSNERFIIFHNDGTGSFTQNAEPMGADTGVTYSSIVNGDYDNDGDLDIALTGYDGADLHFKIFKNSGGSFTLDQNPMGAAAGVNYSYVINGDYDNDGDLDIALTGADASNYYFIIFKNNDGTFTRDSEPLGTDKGVNRGCVVNGDFDNDGDLDIGLTGLYFADERFVIFKNDGGGNFTRYSSPMSFNLGLRDSSIASGDYDSDGDLDIALTGTVVSNASSNKFIIFKNEYARKNTNTLPTAPTEFDVSYSTTTGFVSMTWNMSDYDGVGTSSSVYFNIRAGSEPGEHDIISGVYGSPLMGNYLRPKLSSNTCGVNLRYAGWIYWAVQTIDTSLETSAWSAEQSTYTGVGFGIPSALATSHSGESNLWEVQHNDDPGGTPPDSDALDGWCLVEMTETIKVATFSIVGISTGTSLTDVILEMEYTVDSGHTGTNYVKYSKEGGSEQVTSIQPADEQGQNVFASTSIFHVINTVTDIAYMNVWFTNDDGGGDNGVNFDYFRIRVYMDDTAPSAVTDFVASQGGGSGEISLSWTSPGDDGTEGTLGLSYQPAQYRIQYTTVTADAETPSFWDYDDYNIRIDTYGVTPVTERYYTVTGLEIATTYYFRIWTGDEVPNWSPLSVGATVQSGGLQIMLPDIRWSAQRNQQARQMTYLRQAQRQA
jgi:hypothetical protein